MKLRKLALVALTGVCVTSLASCGGYKDDGKNYTYNTYTTLTPSNWNELTYQDANDSTLIGYLNSSFFTYDYQFENGEIVPGKFEVEYAAAEKLEDVTTAYAGQYAIPADAKDSYAYKITLRDDLMWEDETPIVAEDFVYTMQQQLDPAFQNYRADSFYNGALIIHNAENYVKQNSTSQVTLSGLMPKKGYADAAALVEAEKDTKAYINWKYSFGAKYENGEWVAAENKVVDSGMTVSQIKAIFEATGYGQYFLSETYVDYTFPACEWNSVGMFVGDNKYEIIVCLDSPLTLLDENGNLTYKAAYNFGGLPLVKKDLYESCKKEPATEGGLWTTNYNSSVETSASWGAYKLTYFQADKQYVLERNENWFGYNIYDKDEYMTDKIVCDQVEDWNSAWLLFQQGKVDSVSIDTSIADTYKYSEQAVFTPDDYVGSLQLQSDKNALQSREDALGAGYNKTILGEAKFRKALSLAVNRTDYNNTCTTSSKAGFGLFNSMHYYDVANGGVYRDTDVAKQVLCDVYGVKVEDYASLDEAHNAITGFDVAQARKLVDEAVAECEGYTEGEIVKLTFGTGSITESTTRSFEYIKKAWTEMLVGTKLEGKLELELVDKGTAWATDFRAGGYEVCMGGWSGAAWDPGYFLLAYLSPDYMYSTAWDTSVETMEFEIDANKEGKEEFSLIRWYNILNGMDDEYNWAAGQVEDNVRLTLIAALEKEILSVYYTVPLQNYYSATLISYKWEYASRDYNTFMGYGGLRYMTYNYTDEEWAQFCADNNYSIDYTE